MPGADRFTEREGNPPVIRAYRVDPTSGVETLVGYVFYTSDVPPEVKGYDAPIEVLVGMDLEGTLTGARVTRYWESLYQSRGHFLGARGFQEQFAGKHITDPFRIRRDVDGISGATITVDALARGVRDAARRVAGTYLAAEGSGGRTGESQRDTSPTVEELARRSWLELVDRGPVERMMVVRDDLLLLQLFVTPIWDDAAGQVLLGPRTFDEALERGGDRARTDHLLLLGLDGSLVWFRPHLLSLVQGDDTIRAATQDVVLFEPPREGKVDDQLRSAGIWMVDRRIDMTRPFTVHFGGSLGMDVFALELPGRPTAAVAAAEPPDEPPPEPAPAADAPTPTEPEDPPEPPADDLALREDSGAAPGAAPGAPSEEGLEPPEAAPTVEQGATTGAGTFAGVEFMEEESQFARTLARTSWWRVGRLVLLLGLVTAAFLSRSPPLRWAALGGTVLVLGLLDHGFLSVSHITSAVAVGPGVYLNDLSLLIIVSFTLITTLLWGRVFCGYLCPFGALQDFLERVVPRRFRRELPDWIHRRGLQVKYLILGVVLVPAILGSHLSLFQYFEPFGTVFFFSSSVLLWVIALGFLAAAVVVPRFYCRYACPLGAALAAASHVSPFRIRRVEQCTVCVICEQACPTGAIRREVVDFPECVRCGVCEVNLTRQAGTCRHPMEEVRSRLVQLTPAPGREG